jgi:hypothetical protein
MDVGAAALSSLGAMGGGQTGRQTAPTAGGAAIVGSATPAGRGSLADRIELADDWDSPDINAEIAAWFAPDGPSEAK